MRYRIKPLDRITVIGSMSIPAAEAEVPRSIFGLTESGFRMIMRTANSEMRFKKPVSISIGTESNFEPPYWAFFGLEILHFPGWSNEDIMKSIDC